MAIPETKEELSLLLYIETCAVDRGGKVQGVRMNAEDFAIARRWTEAGFIRFGRLPASQCDQHGSHAVILSDEAWKIAAGERKRRAAKNLHYEAEDALGL
jgi:hypothetical protein